jgi:anaphase-promoting complex subunit 6
MSAHPSFPAGGGAGISGRSPFPHRPTRTRANTARLSLESGDAFIMMDPHNASNNNSSQQISPFAGLLRFSPHHATATATTGVSPYGRRNRQTRFFESQPPPAVVTLAAATTEGGRPPTAAPKGVVQDGIPVDHLRNLATQALLDSPSQAIFYANLLYAKTGGATDALLLGQTYHTAGEHAACLRVLEESGILQSSYPWEGLLLACAALGATEEWAVLLEIVEDACRLADHATTPALSFRSIAATQPLEDDDRFGWDALKESIPATNDAGILHPLARLCCWRAVAYYETGHGLRATVYWKRALEMDCQMQKAWDALLQRNLLTAAEGFDLVQSLAFRPDQEWLRALYLASIELTPAGQASTTTTTEAAMVNDSLMSAEFGAAGQSFLHSNAMDASSIHMMESPIQRAAPTPKFPVGPPLQLPVDSRGVGSASKLREIQTHVNQAFDKLQHEYQLDQSPQVLAMAARRAYRRYDWKAALDFCEQLATVDPFLSDAAFCYVATLIMLGYKRVLFRLAHEWVEASPKSAKAWFAVGAYYYSCERYHVAQRHFCRATRLDPQCTEAWIAFGCSFAACDESDQALASFRAAQRLSPGEHTSLLYMGMEYVRTNHLVLANYFLQAALSSSTGADPLCLHELGVLAAQQGEHAEAIDLFQRALRTAVGGATMEESIELCLDSYWEPTLFNMGHSLRKRRQFTLAAGCYHRCIALCPDKHSTYSAYAFAKHLDGELDTAIEYYHQALSCKPEDSFSEGLLSRALQEALTKSLALSAESDSSFFSATPRSASVRPSLGRKMSDDSSDVDMSAG